MGMEYYYVAFLDILGYANMVKSDHEGPSGEESYVNKLLKTHKMSQDMIKGFSDIKLIQFSDSVIFTAKYNTDILPDFLRLVSDYQFNMIMEGMLVRGGITFGKHYHEENFLFSSGLIDAYYLESKQAKYPRILLSQDLYDLINGDEKCLKYIISNRNSKVIDFLSNREIGKHQKEILYNVCNKLITKGTEDSLIEKGVWLSDYLEHKGISGSFVENKFVKV